MSDVATDVAAVIVDFHAGQALDDCVDSLHANGVTDIVVVENGEEGSTLPSLSGQHVVLVVPKLNLGYGGGVNRGAAAAPSRRYLLVSNPDVVVHDRCLTLPAGAGYRIVSLAARRPGERHFGARVRVHVMQEAGKSRIIGVER